MKEQTICKIIKEARIVSNKDTDKAREEYYAKTMDSWRKWTDFKEPYETIWRKKIMKADKIYEESIAKIPDSKLKEKLLLTKSCHL